MTQPEEKSTKSIISEDTRKLGITEHKKIEKELKFGGPLKQTSSKFISKPEEFRTKLEYREPNPGSKEGVTYFDFDDDWTRKLGITEHKKIEKELKFGGPLKQTSSKFISKPEEFRTKPEYREPNPGSKEDVTYFDFDDDWTKPVYREPNPGSKEGVTYFDFDDDWQEFKKECRGYRTERGEEEIKRAREINLPRGNGIDTVLLLFAKNKHEFKKVQNVAVDYITTVKKMNRLYGVQENVAFVVPTVVEVTVVHHLTCQYDDVLYSLEKFEFDLDRYWYSNEPESIILAYSAIVAQGRIGMLNGYELYPRIIAIISGDEEEYLKRRIQLYVPDICPKHLVYVVSSGKSKQNYNKSMQTNVVEHRDCGTLARHLKNLVTFSKLAKGPFTEKGTDTSQTEKKMVSIPMPEVETLFSYDIKLKARMSKLELEKGCSPSTSIESAESFMSRTNVEERLLAEGVKTKTIVETMLHLLDNDADFHDTDMVDILQIVQHSYNVERLSKRYPYIPALRFELENITAEYLWQMKEAIAAIRKGRWDTPRTIIASIELGSTYSGYAFSTIPDNMHTNMEYATFYYLLYSVYTTEKGKTRTMLLLNPDTSFSLFGYEAEQTFLNLTKEKMKYYFFDFKNMNLGSNTSFKDVTDKQMSGEYVFSHIIRHLRNGIEAGIRRKFDTLSIADKDIWYTFAIPYAWKNQQKCILEAATLAGIDKERFVVIQKAEAAVSILRDIPLLKSRQKAIEPGDKIMVAYLGGVTTHFSSYEVQEGWSFKEHGYYNPESVCGNSVNTAFIKYLENVFGSDNMENLRRDNLDEFVRLCSEFERKKASVRKNQDVRIRIPEDLQKPKKESELPYDFSSVLSQLTLKYDTFCGFFQPVIDRIVSAMQECLLKKEFDDVSVILMAGGFSECELVQNAIQGTFENKRVYIPYDPKLIVLSGGIFCDQIVQHILTHSKNENDLGSALVLTSRCGDIETVKKAIHDDAGVNVESLGKALDVALRFNQDDIAQELIKAGADVNIANLPTNHFYALEDISLAIEDNSIPTLKQLMPQVFPSDVKKKVWNVLYIAAAKGTSEMCEYLIKDGFPSNSKAIQNAVVQITSCQKKEGILHLSPLSVAAFYKKTDNTKILAQHSNEFTLTNCIDQSPEIEAILLNEMSERLRSKYLSLKPIVVAGHQDDKALLIVYSDSLFCPRTEEYCGRKVVIKNPKFLQRQEKIMMEDAPKISTECMKIAKQVINDRGGYLWKTHSNLNIITVSSIKYVRGEKQTTDCCITLFCTSKGFIPLGEKSFPKELRTLDEKQTIPVDTREGYFEFCPSYTTGESSTYHERLKMGCLISNAGGRSNGGGTLGPFVDINGFAGFLTCAHVLFDINNVPFVYNIPPSSRVDVVQPAAGTFSGAFQSLVNTPCGSTAKAVFNPNLTVSIDAAAVVITNPSRIPDQGQFAIKHERSLSTSEFDELPVYNTGCLRDPKDVKPWVLVYKFGSETHLTKGLLVADGTQVRPLRTTLGLPGANNIYVMQNQMEIASVSSHSVFFQPGDSGSAVFTRREDGSLECIGIAIGCTSNLTAVVTPISAILNELGVTLKTFP